MGIMLLILCFILVLVFFVLVTKSCMYKDYRWYRRYMKLRQKLFWNVFIRYILQSILKLWISAGSVLMLEHQSNNLNRYNVIFPTILAIGLMICPIVFWRMIKSNSQNLWKPSVIAKIGTLYLGLDPYKPYVFSYSLVFILRRLAFVVLTFGLFNYPGI